MKLSAALLLAPLLVAAAPLRAQLPDDLDSAAQPPIGSTLITADELHSDEATHQAVFTGKVTVTGQNFHMTCQEMTVLFTSDNKVSKIVATGDVVITQPGRVTHCGHAVYDQPSDTFDLTQEPIIYQGKEQLKATEIVIDRTSQKLTTKGGRTTLIMDNASMGQATTTPLPGGNPDGALPNATK